MAGASYVQSSFVGGEVSKFTQGRYHDQHYRTWMDTCLNGLPIETEGWVRRPGFALAGTTRSGAAGRVIKFDFEEVAPYTMEFTDGHLRFFQGDDLATTNDSVAVSSISAANPAVVALATAVTWSTGDQAFFSGLSGNPLLENRAVTLTKISTATFSLADAVTGANIDGSMLVALSGAVTLNRIYDIATIYTAGAWQNLRVVQTEITAFLLHPQFPPYQISVAQFPTNNSFASFSLAPSFFEDGPYLDPVPEAVASASSTQGIVTISLDFPAYDSSAAYTTGDFVDSSGVGYQSLQDANTGNTPASSPTFWQPVGFGAAINGGSGFVASDTGRLIRLFSEPPAWAVGTTYGTGTVVSYNPSGLPGQTTYWQSLVSSNTGNAPGIDATHWELLAQGGANSPALWSWGKILGLSTTGAISGGTGSNIGDMTNNGGLAAAFDGLTNKTAANCAALVGGGPLSLIGASYIGKNYGGSPKTVSQAVVVPSNDFGFGAQNSDGGGQQILSIQILLYGSNAVPSGNPPSNGTLLANSGIIANTHSPITLQVPAASQASYQYYWIELTNGSPHLHSLYAAQMTLYTNSASPGTAVSVEILGPALLYASTPINTWRLGVYSGTTGYPTCGTYSDGRLWLAGAQPNRVDASIANGINGVNNGALLGSVNFAPTDQFGNVLDSSGISYVFNSPDTNPILWMIPDLQGILAGTLAGEWLIQAPTSGGFSPTNFAARRVTTIGGANIEPRRTEHTIVFVQRFLRKIVEFFPDVFSGKFTAPNLNKDSKNLTIGNIQEIAFQRELSPTIWARVANGLIGSTYKRDTLMTSSGPTMNGWHRHTLGSGRQVESICVGSAVNGTLDTLFAVTNDPNKNVRFVEILSPILDEGTALSEAAYLDAAIVPSSTSAVAISNPNFPYGGLQLNGLWPLNGYTVSAWLGGLDCGDYVVSNGSIQVPYGDGIGNGQGAFPAGIGANRGDQGLFTSVFVASGVTANGVTLWIDTMPILVGFTYTSQGRIVRPNLPAESGARSGPAFAKKRRSQWIMMQVEGSQGVSWGTQFDSSLQPVRFAQANGKAYTVDLQFSGIVRDNPHDDYSFDSMLAWQVTRPFICNVQAIGAALETQDI